MNLNKLVFLVLLASLFSSSVIAGDIPCHGNVVFAMADHSGCADSNGKRQMAFKTNLSSNPWMCARTDLGSSMILAAKASGKPLQVYISDQGQGYTCSNVPGFSKVSYLIMAE